MKAAIAKFNEHIDYDDPTHVYKYKGVQFTSITTLLKQFFPFDAEAVALKCSKGKNPSYAGKEVQEILDMWSSKARFGTDLHVMCENYFNGDPYEITNDREQRAYDYIKDVEYEEIIMESLIVSPEHQLAGSPDVLIKQDGKWYIWDWKTDKKVETRGFKGETCPGILSDFPKCNHTKYTFQLGIYRYILEEVYGIKIHGMKVVHFDTNKTVEYDLKYYKDYIEEILEAHKNA